MTNQRRLLIPVTIRGVIYPTIYDAAEALNVRPVTVYNAKKRGRLDTVGMGSGMPMQICIRGVTYPSAKAAAEALGVALSSVYSGLERNNPDSIGLGVNYKTRRHGGGRKRAVVVAGVRFETIKALADFLGRDRNCVSASLKAGEIARGRIIRAVMKARADAENARMKAEWKKLEQAIKDDDAAA